MHITRFFSFILLHFYAFLSSTRCSNPPHTPLLRILSFILLHFLAFPSSTHCSNPPHILLLPIVLSNPLCLLLSLRAYPLWAKILWWNQSIIWYCILTWKTNLSIFYYGIQFVLPSPYIKQVGHVDVIPNAMI